MKRLLPIVEGDGDIAAVPELIRRVAHSRKAFDVEVLKPHKRGDLPKIRSRFSDYLETALLEDAPILWVLDYDCEDCRDVNHDTKQLVQAAKRLSGTAAIEFVFFVKEYETLFLADHETTRAVFPDISGELHFPPNPESIRDAKGWLSSARPKGSAYKPMQHQQRITAQLNFERLRARSPSFIRFETAVLRLLKLENHDTDEL